jgi:2-hydroxycyclohexanecarboxyl-CoA dehydrogenase
MRARFEAEGDVIVVTGGANGIGRALACAAAQAGARVLVCDVDAAAMAALPDVPGLTTVRLDVSDRAEVLAVLGEVERRFGGIDGLVCAAAIQPRSAVHEMDPAAWERVLRVNLDGVVWCYQAVVPGMIARRSGSIIAFTSGLAQQGWPGASAYAASKAAVESFTMGFAKDVALEGIRAVSLRPGMIETEMTEKTLSDRSAREAIESTIAMGRVGQAQEIANAIVWLLSDEASFISGVTLDASGGGFVFGKR